MRVAEIGLRLVNLWASTENLLCFAARQAVRLLDAAVEDQQLKPVRVDSGVPDSCNSGTTRPSTRPLHRPQG